MGVTINEVAKLAGVSASTVSRALANHPRISEETKIRVRKAVEELHYYPHAIARSLASNSTKTIGLILNTEADLLVRNPFFIQALAGVSNFSQENGYNVMMAFNENEEEDLNIAMRYVSGRSVDGIVLFTSRTGDRCIRYLKNQAFPFSVIGRPDDTREILWVDNDNFQATYQITDYLIMKGKASIAYIGGPAGMNVSRDRLEGYKRALSVHAMTPEADFVFDDGRFSDAYGHLCMMKMIALMESGKPGPDAVVTCDDMQAIGVLRALREKGITNISVTGFNNTPLADYQKPTLTSVDINAERLGYFAAKLLCDKLENTASSPSHYIVPTALVERESTT